MAKTQFLWNWIQNDYPRIFKLFHISSKVNSSSLEFHWTNLYTINTINIQIYLALRPKAYTGGGLQGKSPLDQLNLWVPRSFKAPTGYEPFPWKDKYRIKPPTWVQHRCDLVAVLIMILLFIRLHIVNTKHFSFNQ